MGTRVAIGIFAVMLVGSTWLHILDPVTDSEVDDALAFAASVEPSPYASLPMCSIEPECIAAVYDFDADPERILSACSTLGARCTYSREIAELALRRLAVDHPNEAVRLVLKRARAGDWLYPQIEQLIAHSELSARSLNELVRYLECVPPPDIRQRVRLGARNVMGLHSNDLHPSIPLRVWLVANHEHGLRLADACGDDLVSCVIALEQFEGEAPPTNSWQPFLGPRISRKAAFFEATEAMRAGAAEGVLQHSYGYLRARGLIVAIAVRKQRESSCRSLSEIVITQDRLNAPGVGSPFTVDEDADGAVSVYSLGLQVARAPCPNREPELTWESMMWGCVSYGF